MWEITVHLAVAGGVYDCSFGAVLFPRDVLDEILDLTESVSEGFPIYSCLLMSKFLPVTVTPFFSRVYHDSMVAPVL